MNLALNKARSDAGFICFMLTTANCLMKYLEVSDILLIFAAMFEIEIKEYEDIRKEYQQKIADRMSKFHPLCGNSQRI